jgi:allantoicase
MWDTDLAANRLGSQYFAKIDEYFAVLTAMWGHLLYN